ncbi:hypothetical protein FSP39_018810 [Pinctada imbricata]|uniref:BEN domain-containing protein n=1 Tax=Pinctada imbricata TaxID=66713 RepID=A0AA88YQ20_PINIB|nr:hypothetical protein FSP39_018810 [Pinctada imbricata]
MKSVPSTLSVNTGATQRQTFIQSTSTAAKSTTPNATSADDVSVHSVISQDAILEEVTSVETNSRSTTKPTSTDGHIFSLLSKMDKKLSFLSKRVAAVEGTMGKDGEGPFSEYEQIYSEVDERPKSVNYSSIPDEYRLSMKELEAIDETTTGNAGNFALKLVKRFFPELYGPDNQRFEYNWLGSSIKKTLDPVRKNVIRYYVSCLYPEVNDERLFRKIVIHAVNEGLRRPLYKKSRLAKKESNVYRGNYQ